MENKLAIDDTKYWSRIEQLGYSLTLLGLFAKIIWVLALSYKIGHQTYIGEYYANIPVAGWIALCGLWYAGVMLSGFARYKKRSHTLISIFVTVLSLVGPLIIFYIRNL
jgi:hypothetical protein